MSKKINVIAGLAIALRHAPRPHDIRTAGLALSMAGAALILAHCGDGTVKVGAMAPCVDADDCGETCDGETASATRSRTRYQQDHVAFDQTCVFETQTQTCQDGAWTAWTGTYAFESCVVSPRVDCGDIVDGGTESRKCYDAALVPADGTCTFAVQTRTCKSGVFDPDWPACEFMTCTVIDHLSCGATPHGGSESRACYAAATVPYGSTCSSTMQTRTCNNGSWNPDYPACAYLSCSIAPPVGHVWDVTVSPPVLNNPTTITLPGRGYLRNSYGWDGCFGPAYVLDLDNTDYIVRTSAVLTAPVVILGGRNVRVIGIHIDLATAACGNVGHLNVGYVPGFMALRIAQVGTTFVEGAYIDVAGRASDCIDPRNAIGDFDALSKGYSESAARGARRVVIQNSVCRGMGSAASHAPYREVHGDILQPQSAYELYDTITFENVSADSNCEGTVIEPESGYYAANQITMRRFDYRMDSRFSPYFNGGPVQHSAKAYSYNQVYIHRFEPPYEMAPAASRSRPCGVSGKPACDGSAGIYSPGTPQSDRFASPGTGDASSAWTGVNYVSPH